MGLKNKQFGFTPSETGRPKAVVAVPSAGRFQTGFTLIELIMVISISALLTVILTGLYRNAQQRTQFRDSVERVVTEIEKIKTEVNSSYTSSPNGNDSSKTFFAKAITFGAGAGTQIQVTTLQADRSDVLTNPATVASSLRTISLPWGVNCYDSPLVTGDPCNTSTLVISRNTTDGALNSYIINSPALITDSNSYVTASSDAVMVLSFRSFDGNLNATITIDAKTNEVLKSYDN